ncbi:MAG TPA: chemotaxis protein CheW [Thermoanaerobaculia bacterium]|nr:chemotaxis protein CheW [Thermoanaerobaculia bacterium]
MVNLAKLRKKAKDKKEKVAEELPAPPPVAPAAPVSPVVPEAPRTDKIAAYLAEAGSSRGEMRREEKAIHTGEQIELLTFVIAGEQYAIDIENVVEIVTTRPVTKIPNANESVLGILSLRGTIVILVDVRGSLGHPTKLSAGPDSRIVVVQHESENIGFMVDRVLRVVKIDPHEIQPHPVVHSSEHDESVKGVFKQGSSLTIVLDFSKLIFNRNEWN